MHKLVASRRVMNETGYVCLIHHARRREAAG
jgi:hypothetical protein